MDDDDDDDDDDVAFAADFVDYDSHTESYRILEIEIQINSIALLILFVIVMFDGDKNRLILVRTNK